MAEDIHDLAAPYALDALDDLERRRFETHLEQCPACLEELAGLAEVTAVLAGAEVAPPLSLKASTLDMITQVPQVSGDAVPGDALSGDPAGSRSSAEADVRVADVPAGGATSGLAGLGGDGNRWPLLVAAVLVAVVAVAALGVVVSRTSGDEPGAEVAAVLDAPDAVRVSLSSDDPAREGTDLVVVHSSDRDATVVVGDHVHGTDADHVYQLWGETPAGMEPAGVFVPGEDGTVEIPVDAELSEVMSWNVTVEPVGGSEEPTSDIVFTSAV